MSVETKFYSYANIIRVLKYDPANDSKSLMIDVNIDDNSILSIFDASERPYDLIFINSFINILSQSTVGFKLTENEGIKAIALQAIKSNDILV